MKKITAIAIIILSITVSCKKERGGSIIFTANGEDFIRNGFVDRNGWNIHFDRVYVNIVNPTAYNNDLNSILEGSHMVDLAEGDENAAPIILGKTENVKPGNYQSLKFSIKKSDRPEHRGASIIMIGNAEKSGKKVDFTIRLNEELDFDGREGYVGDEIKGIVKIGEQASVEMTFHFDHIFGDIEAEKDDHINTGSVGFDYFYAYAKDERVDVSQEETKSNPEYAKLVKAIWTLGHLGEGHCEALNQTSTGLIK